MSSRHKAQEDLGAGPITLVGKRVLRAQGYTRLELERAGLTEDDARRLGLTVDPDRKTMVGSNVMQLRRLISA